MLARGRGGVDGGEPEALRSSRVRKSFCFCKINISVAVKGTIHKLMGSDKTKEKKRKGGNGRAKRRDIFSSADTRKVFSC